MTHITCLVSDDMIWPFPAGYGAIMATLTGANSLRMIHGNNWSPGRRSRCVAGIALVCRVDMREPFTLGGNAIVATDASTDNFIMIDCNNGYK